MMSRTTASDPLAATLAYRALVVALVGLAVGCGGAQREASVATPALVDVALPPIDDLDAFLSADTEHAADALLRSYAHVTAGDNESALDVLAIAAGAYDAAFARRAVALYGEVSGWDRRTLAMRDARGQTSPAGDLSWLWVDAVRAKRAHERGDGEGVFAAPSLGVPASWRSAGPVATRGDAHVGQETALEREASIPLTFETETGAHRSVLVASSPTGDRDRDAVASRGALMLAETFIEVDAAGTFLVETYAPGPYVATLDGHTIASREPGVWGASGAVTRVWLDAGTHRLVLRYVGDWGFFGAMIVPAEDARVLRVSAAPGVWDAGGTRVLGAPTPWSRTVPTPTSADGLAWLVAADAAILSQDPAVAEQLLALLPEPAEAHPVVADRAADLVFLADGYDFTWRAEQSLRYLQRAVEWPGAIGARVRLAAHYVEEEQLDAAWAELAPILDRIDGNAAAQHVLSSYFAARGWDDAAYTAFRAAATLAPECGDVEYALDWMRERGDAIDPAALPSSWAGCDAFRYVVATEQHLAAGRIAEADAMLWRIHTRSPTENWVIRGLAELRTRYGGDVEAVYALAAPYFRFPYSESIVRADAAAQRGELQAAADEMARRVAEQPYLDDVRAGALALAGQRVSGAGRRDGVEIVRDYLASDVSYQGGVVYVWDYAEERYDDVGRSFSYVHQVIELRSREALADYGEVGVPAQAVLLNVRTIKRDGRTWVPEDIEQKDAISLPNLEVGDFIEMEWSLADGGAAPLVQPSVRTSRFYFQSPDGPFHASVADYDVPAWWGEPHIDLRGEGATIEQEVDGDRRRIRVRADRMDALLSEPSAPPGAEWAPSVRLSWATSWEDAASSWHDAMVDALVQTPDLVEAAGELVADAETDQDAIRAIFRYVSDEVIDIGGGYNQLASWTYRRGEGDPLLLLVALLEAAGYAPDVVFVRPVGAELVPDPVPSLASFELTLVRATTARGEQHWMQLDGPWMPFGYLDEDARGMQGLVVWGANEGEWVTTPTPTTSGTRTAAVVTVSPTGDAWVEGETAFEAGAYRTVVELLESEQMLDAVAAQLEPMLSAGFSNVSGFDVRFELPRVPTEPLSVFYAFHVDDFVTLTRERTSIGGSFGAIRDPERYAARADRTQPLVITTGVNTSSVVTYRVPEGWEIGEAPPSSAGETPGFVWSTEWEVEGREATCARRAFLPAQRVSPSDYPPFAEEISAFADQRYYQLEFRRAEAVAGEATDG